MRIDLLLLAAGPSVRMGQPKQLISLGGTTLIRRALSSAVRSKVRSVIVVLGAGHERIVPHIKDLNARIVLNDEWSEGLGASIRRGVSELPSTSAGVLLHLCDMPGVDTAHLNSLVDLFESSGTSIVASRYDGILGVPVVFSARYFGELLSLTGDSGARAIIDSNRKETTAVDLVDARDIDTLEDLKGMSA